MRCVLEPSEAAFQEVLLHASGTVLLVVPATGALPPERGPLRAPGRGALGRPGQPPSGPPPPPAARWADIPDGILDVGHVGRWWALEARTRGHDVN